MPRYLFADADQIDERPSAPAGSGKVITNINYVAWGDEITGILDADVAMPMTLAANAIIGNISRGRYRAVIALFSGTLGAKHIYPERRKHVIQLRFNEQNIGYIYEVGEANLGTLMPTVFAPRR